MEARNYSFTKSVLPIKNLGEDHIELIADAIGLKDFALWLGVIGIVFGILSFAMITIADYVLYLAIGFAFLGICGIWLYRLCPTPTVVLKRGSRILTVRIGTKETRIELGGNPLEVAKTRALPRSPYYYYIRIHGNFWNKKHIDIIPLCDKLHDVLKASIILNEYINGVPIAKLDAMGWKITPPDLITEIVLPKIAIIGSFIFFLYLIFKYVQRS